MNQPFQIIKPEHSMLHIRVVDVESSTEIAQRFLPVHKIQADKLSNSFKIIGSFLGYRHIILRNRANRSEGPCSIFVKITSKIYVPAAQEELRQQFANPLKCLKEEEEARQAFANPMRGFSQKRKTEPIGHLSRQSSQTSNTILE
jgi:hypothetical protein